MPQGHFAAAGAGAGRNGLARNNPEAYNPGREKDAYGNAGRGWRYCTPSIDNAGMPGRVKGRPPGGHLTFHPDIDSRTPFPEGEGTRGGPVQDSGRSAGPQKRRPTLRPGAPKAKVAEALRRACGDGDSEAVAELLAGPAAELLEEPNGWTGQTALIECAHGPGGSALHLVTLRLLIDAGASLDAQDTRGGTAVRAAAQRGYTMAVHALMVAGCDVGIADEDGSTPLMAAAQAGKHECVETLVTGEAPPPRQRHPSGPFAVADVDAVDGLGRTAAVIAAQHGRQNCLHLLAARGAGLEGMDRLEGATVFHHACKKGWADLAEHLLVCGADPAAVDEKGLNGMNLAEAAAQEPVVQRLRDIALGGDHARLLAEISQPSSSMNPRGQVHALGSFTNDPTWLDPLKHEAAITPESTEFVRPGRGGYADPGFRFPGPSGGAAQWKRRGQEPAA